MFDNIHETNIMKKITFLLFFTLNFLTAQTTYNFDWSYGTPDQQIEIEVGDTVEVFLDRVENQPNSYIWSRDFR